MKNIDNIVENTILLLKALSEGQGFASIEVFDVGAGGGFSSGKVFIEHLRDGKSIDRTVYESPIQLKELIIKALESDNGLPKDILLHADWDEYVAESE